MGLVLIDELQIGLVYEGSRLKRVVGILAAHIAVRKAVQFLLDEWEQPFERCLVAVAPIN